MTKVVYLTVCTYGGCENCQEGGSHVVAASTSIERAEKEGKRHKDAHYGHHYYIEIEEHDLLE